MGKVMLIERIEEMPHIRKEEIQRFQRKWNVWYGISHASSAWLSAGI